MELVCLRKGVLALVSYLSCQTSFMQYICYIFYSLILILVSVSTTLIVVILFLFSIELILYL